MADSIHSSKLASALSLILILLAATMSLAQTSDAGHLFENDYVRMKVLPGWTLNASSIPLVKLTQGKYTLQINPIFTHASGTGRLDEVISGMPSVEAVMAHVEGPWPTSCSQGDETVITGTLSLLNLYTDKSISEYGCTFPSDDRPAWFGAYFSGDGSEAEYTITLAYDSTDVNALPKEGTSELNRVLRDVTVMLKSLELKPPILITSIEPHSAPPGATITVHGSGFDLPNANLAVSFRDFRDNPMVTPTIAADGHSMTFQIPTTRQTMSCKQPAYIEVGGNCVPAPAHHVDTNDCPQMNDRATIFCAVPMPPGSYRIWITGAMVHSNEVSLTINKPKSSPVAIAVIYPGFGVLEGDTIRVRGFGFTRTANTITIGDAVVRNISSPDRTTLIFEAPPRLGTPVIPMTKIYKAVISNANGQSDPIWFGYE